MLLKEKIEKRLRRRKRVRAKISGTQEKPRLSVFKSNKHIFAQIINDVKQTTLVSVSDFEVKKDTKTGKKGDLSFAAGELLASKAKAKKIKKVAFDKGGYKYHGRIKSFAEGARKGGLEF